MSVAKSSLNRLTLLFPLALVLFEFSVYIGNDLIQPAMLAITKEFGVSSSWAPSSMSFYLLGGACVAWLLGLVGRGFGCGLALAWSCAIVALMRCSALLRGAAAWASLLC